MWRLSCAYTLVLLQGKAGELLPQAFGVEAEVEAMMAAAGDGSGAVGEP